MAGLQVAFEDKKLVLANGGKGLDALVEELTMMRLSGAETRDDLALALALAWWKASRPVHSFYGPVRIV